MSLLTKNSTLGPECRGAGTAAPAALADPIKITLPGEPRGKGRPRFGNGRTYTPDATRRYEDALRKVASEEARGRRPMEGPLSVSIEARMPIPTSWRIRAKEAARAGDVRPTGKPDADNLMKVIDALNGIVWRDDSQIVEARVVKIYSEKPALVIDVRPI